MGYEKTIALDEKSLTVAEPAESPNPRIQAEKAFVEKLRAGDAAAFEELVARHSRDIYGLLLRLMKDPEEASDVTQEVFIRAFRAIGRFRGDSALRTWLYRIAINQSRSRYRWWKLRRRDKTLSLESTSPGTELTLGESIPSEDEAPDEALIRKEQQEKLESAIRGLPEHFREAVVLFDVQGFAYEEIASILGIKIGTVKSRISRGRRELRRILSSI